MAGVPSAGGMGRPQRGGRQRAGAKTPPGAKKLTRAGVPTGKAAKGIAAKRLMPAPLRGAAKTLRAARNTKRAVAEKGLAGAASRRRARRARRS